MTKTNAYPITTLKFAEDNTEHTAIHPVDKDNFTSWHESLSVELQEYVTAAGFTAGLGQAVLLPNKTWVIGLGTQKQRQRERFILAAGFSKLPAGNYKLSEALPSDLDLANEALGCLLTAYRYDRYKSSDKNAALLVAPAGIDAKRVLEMARGEALTRDLINTPTSDMGPDNLAQAAEVLAQSYGASVNVICGDDLLAQNFPMIHAVGRAAKTAPRLIELNWGDKGPQLTLVGKGICFDTGGLDIKPASSMGLMKKDMGGAATVLGLAQMIMGLALPIRLRVLIPAAENAISGDAFRPGDVLRARNGLTVEVNNTDAEGRLVLADALALAAEGDADLIISMATLTGAARVAVGPDLAPFYAQIEEDADILRAAGRKTADPLWQMPFHQPYEKMIEPSIADLDNAPSGGFAGSITAALFLRRFVGEGARYVHFDIYGWNPTATAGRPKGGAGQGARAILEALPELLNL